METRKELKDKFKSQKSRIGVFQIRNTANGKIYVESSNNLDAIWNRNRFQLNGGLHPNTRLQEDWKNLGQVHFTFEILSEINQDEEHTSAYYSKQLKQLESMFLDELKPFGDHGYNIESSK